MYIACSVSGTTIAFQLPELVNSQSTIAPPPPWLRVLRWKLSGDRPILESAQDHTQWWGNPRREKLLFGKLSRSVLFPRTSPIGTFPSCFGPFWQKFLPGSRNISALFCSSGEQGVMFRGNSTDQWNSLQLPLISGVSVRNKRVVAKKTRNGQMCARV